RRYRALARFERATRKTVAADEIKEDAQYEKWNQREQIGIGAVKERLVCQLRVPSKRGRAAARARLNRHRLDQFGDSTLFSARVGRRTSSEYAQRTHCPWHNHRRRYHVGVHGSECI